MEIKPIAKIYTDLPEKFGIPRQSGIVESLKGKIVFEPEYRVDEALKGLEEFSHLWLIWEFSENVRSDFSPTVRPPRLGGEERRGVFATRSPFRPNPIGLSCVRLERIEREGSLGRVIYVSGIDMMDGTPVYDIKPYITYTDCRNAVQGFAEEVKDYSLEVVIEQEQLVDIPEDKVEPLVGILAGDPRPAYHNDPGRIYGISFAGMNIKFRVEEGILYVTDVERGV